MTMTTTFKCASDSFFICVLLALLRKIYSQIKKKAIVFSTTCLQKFENATNEPAIFFKPWIKPWMIMGD